MGTLQIDSVQDDKQENDICGATFKKDLLKISRCFSSDFKEMEKIIFNDISCILELSIKVWVLNKMSVQI